MTSSFLTTASCPEMASMRLLIGGWIKRKKHAECGFVAKCLNMMPEKRRRVDHVARMYLDTPDAGGLGKPRELLLLSHAFRRRGSSFPKAIVDARDLRPVRTLVHVTRVVWMDVREALDPADLHEQPVAEVVVERGDVAAMAQPDGTIVSLKRPTAHE